MINFRLRAFIDALADLNVGQTRARMADPDTFPTIEGIDLIRQNLAAIDRETTALSLPLARSRLARVAMFFTYGATTTYGALSHEIDELFNAVERDAGDQFFCHYDNARIGFLQRMPSEWASVLAAFPSAKPEIEAGVDCYALGHNTACVFHMVRVAEIGLRVAARERGIKNARKDVPLDWGTWGQVFGAIEGQLKAIRNKPPGPKKEAALTFYDTVLSDLHAIQSLFRDRTMHLRKVYDDGEAQSAMFRARELMATLARMRTENSTRSIPWGAWK